MKAFPALVLLAGLLVAADGSKQRDKPTKTDQEAIQGTWKVVDAISAGEKAPNVDQENLLFIFEGDKLETRALDKVETRGTFKVYPSKKPKTFDGRIAGEEAAQLGIYELEGDKLKLCLPNRGKEGRPSEFSSTKENKCSLFFLERTK